MTRKIYIIHLTVMEIFLIMMKHCSNFFEKQKNREKSLFVKISQLIPQNVILHSLRENFNKAPTAKYPKFRVEDEPRKFLSLEYVSGWK